MAQITVTPKNVRLPNETETIKIRGIAGAAGLTPGMSVYKDGTNNWKAGDADAAAAAQIRGVILSLPNGSLSSVVGDMMDIVTHGRITGFSGMTPGATVFQSTVAGGIDHTSPPSGGDYPFAVGWADSDTVLYVNPQISVPTVNP